jgi:ligand-binding SRPBCC domain-containing protein
MKLPTPPETLWNWGRESRKISHLTIELKNKSNSFLDELDNLCQEDLLAMNFTAFEFQARSLWGLLRNAEKGGSYVRDKKVERCRRQQKNWGMDA